MGTIRAMSQRWRHRAAAALLGAVVAVAGAGQPQAAEQTERPVKIAYNLPREHAVGTYFEVLAREIATRTAHTSVRLIPQTFPDGQLYNDTQLPDAVSTGAVDIGMINLGFMAGKDADVLRIWALPFLYSSWEAEWNAEDSSAFRKVFDTQLRKYDQEMLGWVQYGSIEIYANKPIHKPADVKGLRLRAFGVDSTTLLRDLGAAPVTMSSQEVYQAMQRGTIDGFSTGPSTVMDRKLYEVSKFGTDVGLSYIPFIATANAQWWAGLPGDVQQAVQQASAIATKAARDQAKADDARLKAELAAKGVTIYTPTPEERAQWVAAAKSRQEEYLRKTGAAGKQLLEVIAAENAKASTR